jgi:site-specific DNA-methyltransferase (adenine-specific)
MAVKEVIGGCELWLSDCREVIDGLSFDSVATDPPFGMNFQSNHRLEKHAKIASDDTAELLRWACEIEVRHSRYVWMRWDNLRDVPMPRSLITWVKNNHSMGDLEHEHARQTEVCAFYKGPEHSWPSYRPNDVIKANRTGNNFHPTEKPVPLMCEVVSWTAGTVLDPFMGSGTTGVACARLGRKFIGIEIDETHFAAACKRIEKAYAQGDLFIAPPPKPEQQGMDL